MKKMIIVITIFALGLILFQGSIGLSAQEFSGKEILERVDQNISSKTRIFQSKMIIHGKRGSRTIESESWAEGETRTFTKYLAPAREKGTKMLKIEKKLWMYSPSTDRTIQISGHMLRQSMMGSDLSYEDMMEDKKLADNYDAVISGTEIIDGSQCWVMGLTAMVEDIAYYRMRLWIDQSRLIPLKEELFAKSGKLLKRMELKDITKIEGRWFPKRMIFKDVLKKGKGTEFIIDEIEFDKDIPAYIFSKASLKK